VELVLGHIALSAHVLVEDQNIKTSTAIMTAIKHDLSEHFGIKTHHYPIRVFGLWARQFPDTTYRKLNILST
jgi:hypothetical protein